MERYTRVKVIGKGAFGRVLLATKRTGVERGRAFASGSRRFS